MECLIIFSLYLHQYISIVTVFSVAAVHLIDSDWSPWVVLCFRLTAPSLALDVDLPLISNLGHSVQLRAAFVTHLDRCRVFMLDHDYFLLLLVLLLLQGSEISAEARRIPSAIVWQQQLPALRRTESADPHS